MKNTSRFVAVAAIALSAVAAQAAGLDFTNNNYPLQASTQSTLTRAEVVAQVKDAVARNAMPVQGNSYVAPKAQNSSALTRAQVRQDTAAAEAAGQLNFGA